MTEIRAEPHLHGVLVTFRRPEQLAATLSAVVGQSRPLDHLVVVDNAPAPRTEEILRSALPEASYVAAPENLGPAGGIALGVEHVLESAREGDWVVVLDDDDPPPRPDVFATLADFATEMAGRDPATGAVGLSGARFDRRRGRMVRVPDGDLRGAVRVDYIAGNQFPFYSADALRAVGPPRRDLFFGFDDLELGMRLADCGYSLYGCGATWLRSRTDAGRLGPRPGPALALAEPGWRRYYSIRNLVAILREAGATQGAVRVSIVVALAKPCSNLLVHPRLAIRHLALGSRACRDAWTGRMGRRVEPA
jgi:glycosyltransferase involved in cell wall biosynthesis